MENVNIATWIAGDGQQYVGGYDGSSIIHHQSQFSPEDSYTTHRSSSSSGSQQTMTSSMTHASTHQSYGSNESQQDIVDFNSAQFPTTNQSHPLVYSTYGIPFIYPTTCPTCYPTCYPTTYPTTYPTNGSMPQYLAGLEQAPALTNSPTLSNSTSTYPSAEGRDVVSAIPGGTFSHAVPLWFDNRDMWIAPGYGPGYHYHAQPSVPGGNVQHMHGGGDSVLWQAWTGDYSCSNTSRGRGPQQPPLPLPLQLPPAPPPPTPTPTPPPPHAHPNGGGGGRPGKEITSHIHCPIAGCPRGPSSSSSRHSASRRPFRRNCNLLEHLRGVHRRKIPLKTKLTTWFHEQGYELGAYLVWVERSRVGGGGGGGSRVRGGIRILVDGKPGKGPGGRVRKLVRVVDSEPSVVSLSRSGGRASRLNLDIDIH